MDMDLYGTRPAVSPPDLLSFVPDDLVRLMAGYLMYSELVLLARVSRHFASIVRTAPVHQWMSIRTLLAHPNAIGDFHSVVVANQSEMALVRRSFGLLAVSRCTALAVLSDFPEIPDIPEGITRLVLGNLSPDEAGSHLAFRDGASYELIAPFPETSSSPPVANHEHPSSLTRLTPGHSDYIKDVQTLQLPASLQHLEFDNAFDEPIAGLQLPPSLAYLQFGYFFNHPLPALPRSLECLVVGTEFNQPFDHLQLPPLLVGRCFQPNDGDDLEPILDEH